MRLRRYRVLFDEDQTFVLAIYIGKREATVYKKKSERKTPNATTRDALAKALDIRPIWLRLWLPRARSQMVSGRPLKRQKCWPLC